LYTKEKGVYYHSYSSDNNSGWGAYTATKEKSKEKTSAYELLKKYDELFEAEVDAYNSNVPRRAISKIMARPDEGFTSDWHKTNAGKLLFGNSITAANVNTAATYKTKFAIDEPIMVSIFADKGFNKYVDFKENDLAKIENYNSNAESVFNLELTLSNGTKASRFVYIKHPANKFLTLYIHDILFAKAKAKNAEDNRWIKEQVKLEGLKEEVQVKVELLTTGNEPYKIAEGGFSFIPRPGAVMPYGRSCSPGEDYKIDRLAKIKPVIAAIFKKALAAKPTTAKLQLNEFTIVSGWQEAPESPFPFLEVNFVVKNEKGECFSGSDKYLWYETKSPAEESGYFVRAQSKVGEIERIVDNLYPYCDCGK
ncbi:MAG: hypothetical protein JST02_10375, partial [Bacteroidetes bacterium]|nr:hypothetical protein [Bacteroidota bacterium]